MKHLATVPWSTILIVAVAWPLAWLLLMVVTVAFALRRTAASESGVVLAAVGFGITPRGILFLVAPPLVLLILRAVAPLIRAR